MERKKILHFQFEFYIIYQDYQIAKHWLPIWKSIFE